MINEIELLSELKRGNCDCLETVIRIYTPYVSTVVYNTAGTYLSAQDIEEVVSDTFFALWINAGEIDSKKGGIRPYIGAVARNKALNKLRDVRYNEELCEDIALAKNDPESDYIRKEENRSLLGYVMSLGETDGEIFLRYYYYNEKIREISEAMGINTSTVKSKLKRGKERLKTILTEKGAVIYEQKQT